MIIAIACCCFGIGVYEILIKSNQGPIWLMFSSLFFYVSDIYSHIQ